MKKITAEKIELLKRCAKQYEANGKSDLTDAEYDALMEEVRKENPSFDIVGAELDEEHIYGQKIKHEVIFGSLNKCPNIDSFLDWIKKSYSDTKSLVFVVQNKIDGLAMGCVYKGGDLQTVATRGDSAEGVDVTSNGKFIEGIPLKIKCKDDVEIRGECYKDRSDFYKNWVGEYENPRNFCSGSVNQSNPEITKERGLSFLAYEVVRKDFAKEIDKIGFLSDNKFNTLEKSTLVIKNSSPEEIAEKVKEFMDSTDRDALPYSIDGIVVKINDLSIKREMGCVSEGRKPRANMAVKFPCQQVVTTIKSVEFSVGKNGKLAPVAILEPVRLNETTVKKVTLHNIKFIEEKKLKIGSEILIQKSGEIIPYCVRKISDTKNATPILIPSTCPSCSEKVERNSTGVDLVCNNLNCVGQLNNRIEYYLKELGIKGIGENTIGALIQGSYIKSISDMYNLLPHKDELSEVFGNKAFANILEAMNGVTEVSLPTFISALSIANIGTMSSKLPVTTIEEVDKLTEEDIIAIDGFGPTKSKSFVSGWKKMRSEISELLKHIKIKEASMKSKKGSKLDGLSFCITGTLSKTRNEFVQDIENAGGRFSSSVGKSLNYLICGEDCGSKKDKAEKLGVKTISESEFNKML